MWRKALPALGILVAGLLAYANSSAGIFLYDDRLSINESLAAGIGPLAACFDESRGLVRCSLAWDYARGGLTPAVYHQTNVAIHLLAALVLLAVLRRGLTLALPASHPCARSAARIAWITTLLWTVHPLQTESVTYVVQRAESMVSLFYLLAFYGALRRFSGGRGWSALAALACFAGVCTKPVIVTAPMVVFLFDRTFVTKNGWASLRARPLLYVGLTATLGWLYVLLGWGRQIVSFPNSNAGLTTAGVSPLAFFGTEGGVILHYCKLAVWPHPLCFDYAWPVTTGALAIASAVAYATVALGLAVWLWRRTAPLAFLGCTFLLLLAPTSSLMPLADLAAEHRMYLALAVVILALVLGATSWAASRGRAASLAPLLAIGAAVVLGVLTHLRNRDYASGVAMYERVVACSPRNARGRFNLANELALVHRFDEAIAHYQLAIRLDPKPIDRYHNLAVTYLDKGDAVEARKTFELALQREPENHALYLGLANALHQLGDLPGARTALERSIALGPTNTVAHIDLGLLFMELGEPARALAPLGTAVLLDPTDARARRLLESASTDAAVRP